MTEEKGKRKEIWVKEYCATMLLAGYNYCYNAYQPVEKLSEVFPPRETYVSSKLLCVKL